MNEKLLNKILKKYAYYPKEFLGKNALKKHNTQNVDHKFYEEPNVEIKKGQIRNPDQFEVENVILCSKVYSGRIG